MSPNTMIEFLSVKSQRYLLKSYHFWIIILISLLLMLIYLRWPWREWQFINSPWNLVPWLATLDELAFIEVRYRIIGSLFLIPIIYSALVFRWRAVYIIALLCIASITPFLAAGLWVNISSWFVHASFLLLPMIVAVVVKIEFQHRQQERINAEERERDRQVYFSKILEAQEEERQRIAQDVHDGPLQMIVAMAKCAEAFISKDDGNESIIWIKNAAIQTVDELRRISIDLRPSILDDMGLIPALRWLIKNTKNDCDINITLKIVGLEKYLSSNVEITILRVVQEAINNIKQHSGASEVSVTLYYGEDSLCLEIKDNGCGFTLPQKLTTFAAVSKLGIIGMHERIKSVGGTLKIKSKSGYGTELLADIKY